MKKLIKTFVLLLIIMSIGTKAIAAEQGFNVRLNGKSKVVYPANVMVNSSSLKSKFSPYINEGRTFVPIREITEALGAKVIWNNKTQSVEVILNNQSVKLKIDSEVVYIDGAKKVIDKNSIPRLSTFASPNKETKTMVPLRFLSESFGFNVAWNKDTKTASVSNTVAADLSLPKEDPVGNKPAGPSKPQSQSPAKTGKVENTDNKGVNLVDKDDLVNKDNSEEEKPERIITKKIKADGRVTIVLDAGHGGSDPGAIKNLNEGEENEKRITEKELNLRVVKALEPKLAAKGYEVVLTRSRDEYVSLLKRSNQANSINAEIFVSVHFNASSNEEAMGVEVLYAPAEKVEIKTAEQYHLAKAILDGVIRETGAKSRGVKSRPDLIVLNKTSMPAALAELGFMSNDSEIEDILSPGYIEKLAEGMYKGIVKYVDNYVE